MSTLSAAAMTDAGYAALLNALTAGGKVFPKTARVSATIHAIDQALTALTDYWWEGDITLVNVIDGNTYEARVAIPPEQADDYMRTVGLYLDDGTLFAVSAAKNLPPGVCQELVIQLSYSDIVALTDFQYLSFEDWQNQLEIMDKFSQLGNAVLENAEAIGLWEGRISEFSDNAQQIGDLTYSVSLLEENVTDHSQAISSLDGQVTLNTADITALTGQVSGQAADISSLAGQVSEHTTEISSLAGQASEHTTEISSLTGQVAEHTTEISSLTGQVSDLATEISSLTGQVSDHATEISSLTGQVSDHTTEISSLTGQVSDHTTEISSLTGQVSDLATEITELQELNISLSVTFGSQEISLGIRKVIDSDITLTCTPESTGADFCGDDALAQALAALDPYEITGNVTIQLADGAYGATTPLQTIELNHKNVDRLSIVGNAADAVLIPIGPKSYAGLYNLPVSTFGNFAVSDFLPGGNYSHFNIAVTGSNRLDGVYTVTDAVDFGYVIVLTVSDNLYLSSDIDSLEGFVYLMPANRCQLIFGQDQNGFVRKSLPGNVRIRGVSLLGQSGDLGETTKGFAVQGGGVSMELSHVMVRRFGYGVVAENFGIIESSADGYGSSACVRECNGGFHALNGGRILAPYACACSMATNGFMAEMNSMLVADDSISSMADVGYYQKDSYLHAFRSVSTRNNVCYQISGGRLDRRDSTVVNCPTVYLPNGTPPFIDNTTGGWII